MNQNSKFSNSNLVISKMSDEELGKNQNHMHQNENEEDSDQEDHGLIVMSLILGRLSS